MGNHQQMLPAHGGVCGMLIIFFLLSLSLHHRVGRVERKGGPIFYLWRKHNGMDHSCIQLQWIDYFVPGSPPIALMQQYWTSVVPGDTCEGACRIGGFFGERGGTLPHGIENCITLSKAGATARKKDPQKGAKTRQGENKDGYEAPQQESHKIHGCSSGTTESSFYKISSFVVPAEGEN